MFFRRKKENNKPPQWLVVGLGNPGLKYQFNRHNAGYLCLDVLSKQLGVTVGNVKFHSLTAPCDIAGIPCLLMKPTTYMNESGQAVAAAARAFDIPPERVLVLTDDISFDAGVLRIRRRGSDGGQKGLRSIAAHLDTEEYPRIKLGAGKKPTPQANTADWVLSDFFPEEKDDLRDACERACEAVEWIVRGDIDGAMGRYTQ
ncbi:MAG: aminoacyl-tRNA hydrolase [Oscillospiraceae bacterium]|nr:aminoacyl-tRNA hydrolase [Oscillospiraceae bacterium]